MSMTGRSETVCFWRVFEKSGPNASDFLMRYFDGDREGLLTVR